MTSASQLALFSLPVLLMLTLQGCGSPATTTAAPTTTTAPPPSAFCVKGVMTCPSTFDSVRCAGLTAACGLDYDFTCTVDSGGWKNAQLNLANMRANVMPMLQNCAADLPTSTSNYDLSFDCNLPAASCKGGDVAWCSLLGQWCFSGIKPFTCVVRKGLSIGSCTGCTSVGLTSMCNRGTPSLPLLPALWYVSMTMWTATTCAGQWTGKVSGLDAPACFSAPGSSAGLLATCWNGSLGTFLCADSLCRSCTNMTAYAFAGRCFTGPDATYPPPQFYNARTFLTARSPCGGVVYEQRPLQTLELGMRAPFQVNDTNRATQLEAAVSV